MKETHGLELAVIEKLQNTGLLLPNMGYITWFMNYFHSLTQPNSKTILLNKELTMDVYYTLLSNSDMFERSRLQYWIELIHS